MKYLGYIIVLAAILAFASAVPSLIGVGIAPGIGLAGIPRAGIIGVPGVVAGPGLIGAGAHGIWG